MMIDDIRAQIGDRKDLLVVDTSRLDAISDNRLRAELREKGITLYSVKNTLARVALQECGFESVDGALAGPSTLVWGGDDIVGLSREMADWAKKINKLEIKGGAVDGQGVDSQSVDEISKGPSRTELIGQIVGLALSPGANVSGALLGPGGLLAGQFKAMGEEDEDSGDAA